MVYLSITIRRNEALSAYCTLYVTFDKSILSIVDNSYLNVEPSVTYLCVYREEVTIHSKSSDTSHVSSAYHLNALSDFAEPRAVARLRCAVTRFLVEYHECADACAPSTCRRTGWDQQRHAEAL